MDTSFGAVLLFSPFMDLFDRKAVMRFMISQRNIYEVLYICDIDSVYVDRLSGYLNRKTAFTYPVRTFSNVEMLGECLEKDQKEGRQLAILISAELYRQIRAGSRKFFTGNMRWILLSGDGLEVEGKEQIEKYQAAGRLCGQLLTLLAPSEPEERTVITGIYSVSSFKKSRDFVRDYMNGLNSKRRLCIFLEELTDLDWMAEHRGMSELFYQLRKGKGIENEDYDLPDYIVSQEIADILPGFRTTYDMMDSTCEQWQMFFGQILRRSGYDEVIIIFQRLPVYPEIFQWLDGIVVLAGKDSESKEQERRFHQLTGYLKMEGLQGKVTYNL